MSATSDFVNSQVAGLKAQIEPLKSQLAVLYRMLEAVEPVSQPGQNHSGGRATGFRDAIRKAIRKHPNGLLGKEVITDLRESGDIERFQGKTKFSVRVHNELRALRLGGEITRKGKRYKLKDTVTS